MMTRPRAPRMSPEDRRRTLLATAAEIVGEGGLEALRMDALAVRAGVTRPVVYEHFSDREALAIALLRDVYERVRLVVVPAEDAHEPDLAAMMTAGVHAYFEAVKTIGPVIRATSVSSFSPAFEAARREVLTHPVTRWAERYVRIAGLPMDLAVTLAAAQLGALAITAEQWDRGGLDRERAEYLHVTASLAGVMALAPAQNPVD